MGARRSRKNQHQHQHQLKHYRTVDQVTQALAQSGLQSLNLIVGIDFTKSNEWTGKHYFHGRNLHHISDLQNPYEHAISVIAPVLSTFIGHNFIPCYGFGDETTLAQDVFSFYFDNWSCCDFNQILARYRELVPHVKFAGTWANLICSYYRDGYDNCRKSGGQYHVLLIIADGQVTRSTNTDPGQLSTEEQMTVDAILNASDFPLSIVLVGVGDGPWDKMEKLTDPFHHFQFVNFTKIMPRNLREERKEAEVNFRALMGIPSQCLATIGRGILGHQTRRSPNKVPLPPPGTVSTTAHPPSPQVPEPTAPPCPGLDSGASSLESNISVQQYVCPICFVKLKDMAFGFGHQPQPSNFQYAVLIFKLK